GADSDQIWVLETNLDDVPAEIIGYCTDQLFAAGAVDVFTASIFMKKNRPGVLLSVLAPEGKVAELEEILFRETMTFGVRRYLTQRHKLKRETASVETPWGAIKVKLGWREGSSPILTPEYDDCARVARERRLPLREVYEAVRQAYAAR